jgi:lipoyl(octanoyl) transferase
VWQGKEVKKISAIGIRVSKWIAYHGFSINVDNDLDGYNNIVPCGIKDKGIINLKLIKDQDYKKLKNRLIDNLIKNLEI